MDAMANARLKIARQAGKRRHRSDAQSVEDASTEAPRETSAEKGEESPRNESSTSTHDVRDAIHDAFRDQKHAIDERLHELTMGKPLPKLQEPGYDVNGYRLKRAHQDFLLQEMVGGLFRVPTDLLGVRVVVGRNVCVCGTCESNLAMPLCSLG